MQKPKNYDATQAGGEFTPVELGGHYLRIVGVREQVSRNGADMIVVAFDFNSNDKQPGYFMNQFNNNDYPDKKWPNQGTQYILVNDAQGNCSKSFKSFITCVERSNNGFVINWDAKDFCAQFKGKLIGGVFGKVESEYNGNIYNRPQLRWFCEYSKVTEQKIPADKPLNNGNYASRGGASAQPSIPNVPRPQEATPAQYSDEPDIPF